MPGAVDQNIKIIRERIDQFGVAEPSIQKLGENRIWFNCLVSQTTKQPKT
jgi:preprotein translocase subunit SecD